MDKYKRISFFLLLFLFSGFVFCSKAISVNPKSLETEELTKLLEVEETSISIRVDTDEEKINGQITYKIKLNTKAPKQLILEARNFKISHLLVNGQNAAYHYDKSNVYVDVVKNELEKKTIQLQIAYETLKIEDSDAVFSTYVKPGLRFVKENNQSQNKLIWTNSVYGNPSFWLPIIKDYKSKSKIKLDVSIPNDFQVFTGFEKIKNNTIKNRTVHTFQSSQKSSLNNLFFIVNKKKDTPETEVFYEIEKDLNTKSNLCLGGFEKLKTYLENTLGKKFPYEKMYVLYSDFFHSQPYTIGNLIVVPKIYKDIFLGQEAQFSQNIAHKIAIQLVQTYLLHYLVPENNKSSVYLESLSAYLATLYFKHLKGETYVQKFYSSLRQFYTHKRYADVALFDQRTPENLEVLKGLSYSKGAAVMQYLFAKSNQNSSETLIRKILEEKTYNQFKNKHLDINLIDVNNQLTLKKIQQWFINKGCVTLDIKTTYDQINQLFNITISQKNEVYDFATDLTFVKERVQKEIIFVSESNTSKSLVTKKAPDLWLLDSNYLLPGKILRPYSENEWLALLNFNDHYENKKVALSNLKKAQENIKVYREVAKNLNKKNEEIKLLTLAQINLRNRFIKRNEIKQIEIFAKQNENKKLKASAIKCLGRLVYFEYESLFLDALSDDDEWVKGNALEALFYLNKDKAIEKAQKISDNLKENIAFPLVQHYLENEDGNQMPFVAQYILNGMYATNNKIKNQFKNAFTWVAKSNNSKAIQNLTDDIVEKGVQYRSYYFHYEAIRLLRKIIQHQHEANATNKFENIRIVRKGIGQLVG